MFEIETQRLFLRKLLPSDQDDLFEILSDEQTCLDDGGFHAFETQDEEYALLFRRFLQQNRYAIVLAGEGKVIGMIHLQDVERAVPTYELGFVLKKDYRRNGYMYEAVSALLTEWFARNSTEMFTAAHFPYNEASKGLLQKLGFTYEGREQNALHHEVYGPIDLICYYKQKGA